MQALKNTLVPAWLDKNENPFSLPPSSREELRELVSRLDINRYPDPEYRELRTILGELHNIPMENIVLGNGGDEILWLLVISSLSSGDPVLYPDPTFSQYHHLSGVFHLKPHTFGFLKEKDRFVPDREAFLKTLKTSSPRLVMLDSPNNPTGTVFDPELLIEAALSTSAPFLVDEAYVDFHDASLLDLWKTRKLPENMLILRTLSKAWGMAGLRLGFAVGHRSLVDKLNALRSPFNVNLFTQKAAALLLRHREWVEGRVLTIRYNREQFFREANRLQSFKAFQSCGNFVLLQTEHSRQTLEEIFGSRGVAVRYLSNLPWEGTWIRITVGTEEEMRRTLEAMKSMK